MSDYKPAVVLIGRTNVGKSTLFNRILGKPQAIVTPEKGSTRDYNLGLASWRGQDFWLIDTGGLDPAPQDPANQAVQEQLEQAIAKGSVILLVIDGKVDPTPQDRLLARRLLKLKKPTILVVNKTDHHGEPNVSAPYKLGLSNVVFTSAKTGRGLGDMLDLTFKYLKPATVPLPKTIIGLIGRTNVGKSSLFNRLLGQKRSIVLPTPHTTRDRQYDFINSTQKTYKIFDTAGIRRQLNKAPDIEQHSVKQATQTIDEVDVALLIIDGGSLFSWQDQKMAGLIAESGASCAVLINKADLVPFDKRLALVKKLKAYLPMISWAPILWVSANTGEGTDKIVKLVETIAHGRSYQFTPQDISRCRGRIQRLAVTKTFPFVDFKQTETSPPRFVVQFRTKQSIPKAVPGLVENIIRQQFNFTGTPVYVHMEGVKRI